MRTSTARSRVQILKDRFDLAILAMLVMATLYFARCYVTLTGYWISLNKFADGVEKMPYQGRMLMMGPLHWADHNGLLLRITSQHVSSMRSPDLLIIMLVASLSLILTGCMITWMYARASRLRVLWWLPAALLLVISFCEYVLHSDNNFLYPYDLLSLLFFTAGIAIIYSRRYWLLILLFPIATLNRETTIFLMPLLLLDACCDEDRLCWKNLLRPRLLGLAATLAFLWAGVLIYVHHRFRANSTDLGFYFALNVRQIFTPEHWPQLLSTGGFLPLFLWYSVRRIADFRLRMYLWIFPAWFLVMSVYGSLLETRIFGELSGLLALTCALAFEEKMLAILPGHAPEIEAHEPVGEPAQAAAAHS